MRKYLAALLLCFAVVAPVNAATVTWYVNSLTFDDGGTVYGSFAYDADTNAFSSVSLTTTAGSIRSGTSYSNATTVGNAFSPDFLDVAVPTAGSTRLLFYLGAPMTNAGGTSALVEPFAREFTCALVGCSNPGAGNFRQLNAGQSITSIPPVPLPAAAWLLLSGLGGLGFLGRRRKA